MPLSITRPKNKIPAFPARAGKNLWFYSFTSQIRKKAHFPAFPVFPAFQVGVDTLKELEKVSIQYDSMRVANYQKDYVDVSIY